jgi:putative transposase
LPARISTGENDASCQGTQNNRAENSDQTDTTTRAQDATLQMSPGSAQRFLSIHAAVFSTFNIQRHLTSRDTLRVLRDEAFRRWEAATAA